MNHLFNECFIAIKGDLDVRKYACCAYPITGSVTVSSSDSMIELVVSHSNL